MKKILVVFTGGTFGMGPKLQIQKLNSKDLTTWLIRQVPEMKKIAHCDVEVLCNLDSCHFQAEHWFELAALIYEKTKSNQYDGVVVLHGTDTLAYSAAAVSYLLSPSPVPIVFTGAQKPLSTQRNDARLNLISALDLATRAPKTLKHRTLVAFHDEVYLGSRVRKKSARQFAAFESPRFPKLATIGSDITFHEIVDHLPKLKSKKPLLLQFKGTNTSKPLPQIVPINLTPQFSSALSSKNFLNELDGILLHLYTSGTAPTDFPAFERFLDESQKAFTPIFAITEREDEVRSLATYPSGKILLKKNCLWCHDLTPEAAFVKIWILRELHGQMTKKQFYTWLKKNWVKTISDECI